MARFRRDNTEGYSPADLAALNAAFEVRLAAEDTEGMDDAALASFEDYIAEQTEADHRLMTADDFTAALETIGWSGRQLSAMLGCDHNLPGRWAAGTAAVPPPIARWLERLARALIANPPPTDWRTKP